MKRADTVEQICRRVKVERVKIWTTACWLDYDDDDNDEAVIFTS